MPTNILTLWDQLTVEHQMLLTQLMESLAALDTQQSPVPAVPVDQPADLSAFLQARRVEYAAMSPEAHAEAEAELADLKAALNSNRAPEPPLFP